MTRARPVADRFWEKVDTSGDCWTWTALRDRKGYGRFHPSHAESPVQAQRMAWRLTRGPIPSGLFVLHHCDNPPCVRPDHLWLGTAADNAHDRDAKGRTAKGSSWRGGPGPVGSRHGMAKLTEPEVVAIRALRARGIPQHAVATRYGVSRGCISDIDRRRRWGWL